MIYNEIQYNEKTGCEIQEFSRGSEKYFYTLCIKKDGCDSPESECE